MAARANNHHRLFHLLGICGFDDIHDIKAPECGETIFPGNTGTLLLNRLRYGLGQTLEILRILDCFRGNATENYERRHITPPTNSGYTHSVRSSSSYGVSQKRS